MSGHREGPMPPVSSPARRFGRASSRHSGCPLYTSNKEPRNRQRPTFFRALFKCCQRFDLFRLCIEQSTELPAAPPTTPLDRRRHCTCCEIERRRGKAREFPDELSVSKYRVQRSRTKRDTSTQGSRESSRPADRSEQARKCDRGWEIPACAPRNSRAARGVAEAGSQKFPAKGAPA